MARERLEENQIWIYAVALALGAGVGLWRSSFGESLEFLISPVLAILLYGMFCQIPFLQLRAAFANRRFTAALLIVNFILVPLLVWLLARLLPQQQPLLLGVYLVLLTPCIDYVIVFTHLGRGDARLVLASTPLLLLAQMLLLPVYLWLFMGGQGAQIMSAGPFLEAFFMLIVLPLGLALATEFWARRQHSGGVWLEATVARAFHGTHPASRRGLSNRANRAISSGRDSGCTDLCGLYGHRALIGAPDSLHVSPGYTGGERIDF